MTLLQTANNTFETTAQGYFTDILSYSAGSHPDWTSAHNEINVQLTVTPQSDGKFSLAKHVWSGTDNNTSQASTAIDLGIHHSLDDAAQTAERLFSSERSSWETRSDNARVLRGTEPADERYDWAHIEQAQDGLSPSQPSYSAAQAYTA